MFFVNIVPTMIFTNLYHHIKHFYHELFPQVKFKFSIVRRKERLSHGRAVLGFENKQIGRIHRIVNSYTNRGRRSMLFVTYSSTYF